MQHSVVSTPLSPSQIPFVARMLDETLELLYDAQGYFTVHATQDQEGASALEKLIYSAEMSRITLRLSSVLAWLMARRAEYAGNITREQAAGQFRLAFAPICLQQLAGMEQVLPEHVCLLLNRTLALYERVARLDSMITTETIH